VLEKIRVGGSDQWVLERSEDAGNPVVLFLHGGLQAARSNNLFADRRIAQLQAQLTEQDPAQ
jgi:hypothetical protein